MNQLFVYLKQLSVAKQVLWCYLIWYITMCVLYFDPAMHIWLTSLGVSVVIGIALILSVSNGNSAGPDFWTKARLFMMPFCAGKRTGIYFDSVAKLARGYVGNRIVFGVLGWGLVAQAIYG